MIVAGQRVVFQGNTATVLTASKPKADIFGVVSQSLKLRGKYVAILIGSLHSELHTDPEEVRKAEAREADSDARVAAWRAAQ